MGNNHSKARLAGNEEGKPVRGQIGKRSSIRFLQRLDSRTLTHRPPSYSVKTFDADTEVLLQGAPQPLNSHPPDFPPLSPSSTTTVLRVSDPDASPFEHPSDNTLHGEHIADPSNDPDSDFVDDTLSHHSSAGHTEDGSIDDKAFDVHDFTGEERSPESCSELSSMGGPFEDEDIMSIYSMEEEEDSEPGTPLAKPRVSQLTPVLRMPTPLLHDSPAHYGFQDVMETIKYAMPKSILAKTATTGAGLFRRALDLQIASGFMNKPHRPVVKQRQSVVLETDNIPCHTYRPARSKYPPAELFRRTLAKDHPLPAASNTSANARALRLHRRPWPENLFRDENVPILDQRIALAMPLAPGQEFCYTQHDSWTTLESCGHPAECGICLAASHGLDGAALSYMCDHCALIVCSDCKHAAHAHGLEALMTRYADGSMTTESKRAKSNRRSAF